MTGEWSQSICNCLTRRSRHQKVGRWESNLGDATEEWVVGGWLWVVLNLNLNLNHNLNPNRYRRSASGDGDGKSTKNGIDPDLLRHLRLAPSIAISMKIIQIDVAQAEMAAANRDRYRYR